MDSLELLSGDARNFVEKVWASHVHVHKADPADLVDTSIVRTAKVEGAVDALRARFGKDAVVKGITFDD